MFSRGFGFKTLALFAVFTMVAANEGQAQGGKKNTTKCPALIGRVVNGTFLPAKGNYVCFKSEKKALAEGYILETSGGANPAPTDSPFAVDGVGANAARPFDVSRYSIKMSFKLDPNTCPVINKYLGKYLVHIYKGGTFVTTLYGHGGNTVSDSIVLHADDAVYGKKLKDVKGSWQVSTSDSIFSPMNKYPEAKGCRWAVEVVPNY